MRYGTSFATVLAFALIGTLLRRQDTLIQCGTCGSVIGAATPEWTLEHHEDGTHTAHPGGGR